MEGVSRTGRTATRHRAATSLVLAAVALGSAACLSKPALVVQSFSIDSPGPPGGAPAAGAVVLSLRPVEVSPLYEGRNLVYRVGEHGIETDSYARFAASPGWMLTAAIAGYLRDSGFVRDVVAPGDGLPARAAVEGYARELCGDWSNLAEPVAVLSLRFRVMAPASGTTPPRELLLKTYTQRIRLPRASASAVVDAWNRGLAEIMKEFLADLNAVLPPAPSSSGSPPA
jgi:cholesterol transport system auxiliary component